MLSHYSRIWLFATPWPIACQAPLSMGFSRQECWRGLPFPPPGGIGGPHISLCGMSEGSVRGSEEGTRLCPQEADICNRSRACSVPTSGLCVVGPREEMASWKTWHLGWAWKGRNHVDFWRRWTRVSWAESTARMWYNKVRVAREDAVTFEFQINHEFFFIINTSQIFHRM